VNRQLEVGQSVSIDVPASSANLGVGFDCLALALDLHLRVVVEVAEGPGSTLSVEGEGKERLALDESNRFIAGWRMGWRECGLAEADSPPLTIAMTNEIPLGRGLGSSAAATVAGLLAATALSGEELTNDRLITLTAEVEGHPDNAAAALLGGFVLFTGGRAIAFEPPALLRCVVFVPERELATSDMRGVLPAKVPIADAVANGGGVGALVAAFSTGDLSLLRAMSADRLHEPYRARVYPELPPMKRAAIEAGAFGAALSGAGSSILALTDEDTAQPVALALDAAAEQLGLAGTVRVLQPAVVGANVS
jgi:homoserine kinase